jgi:hypothetical protein
MSLSLRQLAEAQLRGVLSPKDPARPQKKLAEAPLVDLETGQLQPLPERLQQIKRCGGWWCPVDSDPALDPYSEWRDYELYEQKFYVNHPM